MRHGTRPTAHGGRFAIAAEQGRRSHNATFRRAGGGRPPCSFPEIRQAVTAGGRVPAKDKTASPRSAVIEAEIALDLPGGGD